MAMSSIAVATRMFFFVGAVLGRSIPLEFRSVIAEDAMSAYNLESTDDE